MVNLRILIFHPFFCNFQKILVVNKIMGVGMLNLNITQLQINCLVFILAPVYIHVFLSQSFCLNGIFARVYLHAMFGIRWKKVQVGKDQEKAQSEKDSHSKNRGGKKPN